jgi:hypothetical protein
MIVTNGFTPVLPGIASRRTCRRNARTKRKGELDLYATLRGPLAPEGGTIGDIAPPTHSVVQQVGRKRADLGESAHREVQRYRRAAGTTGRRRMR